MLRNYIKTKMLPFLTTAFLVLFLSKHVSLFNFIYCVKEVIYNIVMFLK